MADMFELVGITDEEKELTKGMPSMIAKGFIQARRDNLGESKPFGSIFDLFGLFGGRDDKR